MVELKQVTDVFWVAPQLDVDDFAVAHARGIRVVINNRPDGEAPDQLSDAQARDAAEAAGLTYRFVPVPSGGLGPEHIEAFRAVVDSTQGPHLAYCRSGTRSCTLWAFSAARTLAASAVVSHAASAGYDLRPYAPTLAALRENKDETDAGS